VGASGCVPLAVVFIDVFAIKWVRILLDIIFFTLWPISIRGTVHSGATKKKGVGSE